MNLPRETLYESDTKRIEAFVLKTSRRELILSLQEWDRDAEGFESFAMFTSWGPNVAREACARATQAAVDRFWSAHIDAARAMATERVRGWLVPAGGGS